MKSGDWRYFKPFFLYPPVGLGLLIGAGAHASMSSWMGGGLFLVGMASWTLLEYVIHRGLFHFPARSPRMRAFVYAAHWAHHENPTDIRHIFAGLSTSIPVSVMWFLLLWALLRQWSSAAIVLTGSWAGYICYEFIHYSIHFRTPRTRWMRYLKRYHLLHHYQDETTRFGVTTPLIDWLLSTYRPVSASASLQAQSD